MKVLCYCTISTLFITLIQPSFSENLTKTSLTETELTKVNLTTNNLKKMEQLMTTTLSPKKATGTFDVNLDIAKEDKAPVGRMIINKQYQGALIGKGIGQMISKRTMEGSAVYYAIEEFSGTLNDKSGSFTLVHHGVIQQDKQSLDIQILGGSGEGELKTISGNMTIIQAADKHSYELDYEL